MISSAPLIAANDPASLADKVRAFVVTAKVKAADGLTLSEFAELSVALMRVAIEAADEIPAGGPERKAYVLDAVGLLFDALADKCVPLALYPIWYIARPAVRSLVLLAASGAIESLLPVVRIAAK
jgi:hypothetical protein